MMNNHNSESCRMNMKYGYGIEVYANDSSLMMEVSRIEHGNTVPNANVTSAILRYNNRIHHTQLFKVKLNEQ